ncbi:MAG: hypothetical protein NVSMB65_13240 [Chloroflexota bacterium]
MRQHQGPVDSQAPETAEMRVPFGPADEVIIAHAGEIAAAIRTAPPGTRVRAEARDDQTFLGVRVFSEAERTEEFEDALPDDQVAYFWDANPGATAATVTALVHDLSGAS